MAETHNEGINEMLTQFTTHLGEIVTGPRLQEALDAVADDWAELAHAIRREDRYASHVTEKVKDDERDQMLLRAEEIRLGHIGSATIAQRLNTKLTGRCVALMT